MTSVFIYFGIPAPTRRRNYLPTIPTLNPEHDESIYDAVSILVRSVPSIGVSGNGNTSDVSIRNRTPSSLPDQTEILLA